MNEQRQGQGHRTALGGYLRDRRGVFLTLAVMVLAFGVVIALYDLPLAAVGYGALISGVLGLVACALDFAAYSQKHRRLAGKLSSIDLGLDGLPDAGGLLEADYRALLAALSDSRRRLSMDGQKTLADMTDYYALWAHQIKVPLAALDLLVQTGSQDKAALKAEIFRIEQYVEMALGYIRLESRSTDYVLRRCRLDDIIRQAVRKYARLFILSGVSVAYEGTEAQVLTDEKWLGFVIEQLLSNAVKYAPSGTVTLEADTDRLIIRDTGMGIDPSDLPRVFEKGYTGYNGRQEGRSTGLGLYLCKRVMGKLSHGMTLTSQPGRGTCVTLTFPKDDLKL